jgi:hypothetical protein
MRKLQKPVYPARVVTGPENTREVSNFINGKVLIVLRNQFGVSVSVTRKNKICEEVTRGS